MTRVEAAGPAAATGLVREVAVALRERVLPMLGSRAGRAHAGRAQVDGEAAGDVTFAIDAEAERFLEDHLRRASPATAFYSEDRGLVLPAKAPGASEEPDQFGGGTAASERPAPDTVLVVDPVDGTRPALAGLESCCVSVAAAPFRDGVTMGEVSVACVVEIPSGAVFLAERGRGLLEAPRVELSGEEAVERMFWTYGFRGRPARALSEVLAELIDASSVGGGTFDLGSAAFDMTRVVTGQLDAYVEPGPRMVAEVPGMRAEFERVGGGAVLNNSPYDLAAAALCLTEAGAVVTDARGDRLDDRPLLGSDATHQMSVVASSNQVLHARIVEAIDAGVDRLRRKRAGP